MPETFSFEDATAAPEKFSFEDAAPKTFSFDEAFEMPKFEGQAPVATPQELETAAAPWYKPPPEWSKPLGGQTEIPSGANTSMPALTIPASAIGKAAGGLVDYFTSPKGATEALTTLTPAAPLVYAKWAYDMIKGGKLSIENAAETVADMFKDAINRKVISANNLGVPKDADAATTQEHIQNLADESVNLALMGLGAVGAGKGAIAEARHLPTRFTAFPEGVPREVPQKIGGLIDRGELLNEMAGKYEEQRGTADMTPPLEEQSPVGMGLESGKIPTLGTGPTFEPSGLKMVIDQSREILKSDPEIAKDFEPSVEEPLQESPKTENEVAPAESVTKNVTTETNGRSRGLIAGTELETWADGVLKGGGTHAGPDVLAAYIVKGAAVIERGATEFAKWSGEMLKEFGDTVKPHLKRIFDESVKLRTQQFQQKTPQAQAAPSPAAVAHSPVAAPAAPVAQAVAAATAGPTSRAFGQPAPTPQSPAASTVSGGLGGLLSRLPAPSDIRERFRPIERHDSPAVAKGFTETIQAGTRARNIINGFLRTAFGTNKDAQERLAKDFVALGRDNRRLELQSRGIPATQVPALSPADAARIRANPQIQSAIRYWNREIGPMISDIRTRNQMIMSPNWGSADLMLNLPGEYNPAHQGKTGVNTADIYNEPAKGEGSMQTDPVEALNQIVRGHLRYDSSQALVNAIKRDVSINPATVVDPKQRANPASFPAPRKGEYFEGPYKGHIEKVKVIDLSPDKLHPDYHYVPLRVAEAWEKQMQDRGVYNTLYDKVRGVLISGGILPGSFLPHVYRETTAVAARIAQSGQSFASVLPSWLGSNEYALYRMMSKKGGMRDTPYGQLMQRLVDRTGADRGSGFVEESTSKLGKAINKPHDILFNPDYGVDVMARRAIADAALMKRFGVKEMKALEKQVNNGTLTINQGMKALESKLNDADMLSVGREVNNTMGWGNTQTRTMSLNWVQRVLPFISSESGKIPDEIRRFTTLNLPIPSIAKSIKRGDYEQLAKQVAGSLANGPVGIIALASAINYMTTKAQTGKGVPISDNPEGRRTDIFLAPGWYLGNLDPGLSRAARITGAKELANSKGKETPDIGRELLNESFSVLDPSLRLIVTAGTGLMGEAKNLYLTQAHELSGARRSDFIPFSPARNTINALGGAKPVAPEVAKDVAQAAGLQLLGEPTNPEKVHAAKRNSAIDAIANKAKRLPRDERRDFIRTELEKKDMWDGKARARIGRIHPGLYKYED